ncbi:hypothetical protein F5Y08DRAFT_293374 [Xylaria arbuscula]|nr:hypothetical protein F5Y08DRAFT_293374 [Xylaria arbuscula]
MVRTEYPTRDSLEKLVVSRQDSIASDSTVENKDPSRSESGHWFNRNRSSSEGDSKSHAQTVNLYTHCGRHTNQYLFGGHSISGSIKDILRKK